MTDLDLDLKMGEGDKQRDRNDELNMSSAYLMLLTRDGCCAEL